MTTDPATDPVTTGGSLFESDGQPTTEQPSDGELHTAAVEVIAAVMLRLRQGPVDEAQRSAADLLDLALEVGTSNAAVLVPDSHAHRYRLADAVRRTGTNQCAKCGGPPYDGRPTDGDLIAATRVIELLLGPVRHDAGTA
jgi:hypothetical protein